MAIAAGIDTTLSILIGLLVTSICLLLASSLKQFNFILQLSKSYLYSLDFHFYILNLIIL